ncbi:MAG: 50S ribosomal protein L3 [Pyrobaculum sp.]
MGLKIHRPRRGSMGVYPRKRASDIAPRVRTWPEARLESPALLGFAAYKAGMAHVVVVEDRPTSPLYGKEVVKAVTVLDAPPLYIMGFRLYTLDPTNGYKTAVGEVWAPELPKDLQRVLTPPKNERRKKVEQFIDVAVDVRALVATQPRLSGIGKKTPELLEIPIGGGNIDERVKYATSILGKTVSVREVFTPGQLVDVLAITKGKGYQGVVKRFGVKILPRWHKHRKGHRRTGTIGPQAPALMFTTPRSGQMGFHQRTEYNKRILKIGENGAEVTPKSGFPHYGVIKGPYVLTQGSVPGAVKRLVVLRHPVRPPKRAPPATEPQVVWVSTSI